MTSSRRPVNRVTSKRKPNAIAKPATAPKPDTTEQAANRRGAPRRPKVAGASSVATGAVTAADQSNGPAAAGREIARTKRRVRGLRGGRKEASWSMGTRRPPARPGRDDRSHYVIATCCLVAAVVLGGFAAVAAAKPGVDTTNRAYVDNAATQEVRAAAEHALTTIYAYDVKGIDGYRGAAKQVVTGKMLADLDKFADTTISAVKQAQTSADAKADPISVTQLSDDRAELLVNLVVSSTKDGVAQQSVAGPVVLHMQKVDGHWLASDIVDQ